MIKVLFFAQLREALDCDSLEFTIEECASIQALKDKLSEKGPSWQQALTDKPVLVAVNQSMINGDCALQDGDEVAMFPPVTGG